MGRFPDVFTRLRLGVCPGTQPAARNATRPVNASPSDHLAPPVAGERQTSSNIWACILHVGRVLLILEA
ncbi:hypothetical protein SRM_00515 [Salinibacter ruber M8]|uniref:Uncharacterized protein n=1 Tax=Salinibacter ruber (strain M8) TaxID=761659 RepID=D5H5Y1_SALRM|nr:hypothetical protein SRM_00515 [Salinibacter ruber M8]